MPDNRVKQYGYLYGLFAVTYVIYLVLFEINGAEDVKEGIAYLFTGLILYAIYTYVIMHNETYLELAGKSINGMLFSSVITGVLFILSVYLPVFQLWIAGCVIIAILYGIYPGIASLLAYSFIYGICDGLSLSEFVFWIIPGIVVIILALHYPKEAILKQVIIYYIYSVIIVVSCHISIYMITKKLDIHSLLCYDAIMTIIYSFIIITAVYVYNYFVPCKITDRTNE